MAVIDIFVFAAGMAAGWYGKDPLTKWWKGAEKFAQDLKDKAEAILKAIKL